MQNEGKLIGGEVRKLVNPGRKISAIYKQLAEQQPERTMFWYREAWKVRGGN